MFDRLMNKLGLDRCDDCGCRMKRHTWNSTISHYCWDCQRTCYGKSLRQEWKENENNNKIG